MNLFGKGKIMDHRRSSEAGNQTDSSHVASFSDVSRKSGRVCSQQSCQQANNPETMYVLRNCDSCQDYTVTACKKCPCPRQETACTGQCPSQESLRRKKKKRAPKLHKANAPRGVGGNCALCQLCGQQEIHDPGQNMCPNCNERIHSAVENYYGQCQGQCQPSGQPCPNQPNQNGHWEQLNGASPPGDLPFSVIVLQNGQNQQQVIDQLTKAMNSNGAQMHYPQQPGNSGYPNSNANNPCAGYIDYEYLDFNRNYDPGRYEQDRYEQERYEQERYEQERDYGYDMGPDPYSSRNSYDDDRYQSPRSCSSFDCPIRHPNSDYQRPKQGQGYGKWQPQEEQPQEAQGCTCMCEFCRKGFETKEKLAMLIAQALEIFVSGHQECKKKNKQKKDKAGEKEAPDSSQMPSEVTSPAERKKSKPKAKAKGGSKPALKTAVTKDSTTANSKIISVTSSKTNSMTFKPADINRYGNNNNQASGAPSRILNQHSYTDSAMTESNNPSFFLPNCEEHRCKTMCGGPCSQKPHDCGRGCMGHCRAACSKMGAGDGRRRQKGRRKRPRKCHHCNQAEGPIGSYSGQAKGCSGCASGGCAGADPPRNPAGGAEGGGRKPLLGLSPIAHYRPGMMKFPVNYLLAGTNFSLVRTAAGVTLHQKSNADQNEVKDLPSFPGNNESSNLDNPSPPPARKWH